MAQLVRPALRAILEAIEGIEAATRGRTFDDFGRDWLLRHGVQRGIEIVSEAARRIPPEILASQPQIPWSQIMEIRQRAAARISSGLRQADLECRAGESAALEGRSVGDRGGIKGEINLVAVLTPATSRTGSSTRSPIGSKPGLFLVRRTSACDSAVAAIAISAKHGARPFATARTASAPAMLAALRPAGRRRRPVLIFSPRRASLPHQPRGGTAP